MKRNTAEENKKTFDAIIKATNDSMRKYAECGHVGCDAISHIACSGCDRDTDPVRKPSHYALDGLDIEAIDVIRSVLGPERFQGYCRGNEIKYLLRADHKNGTEDLEKAQVYLGWEIQSRKEQHEEDNEQNL